MFTAAHFIRHFPEIHIIGIFASEIVSKSCQIRIGFIIAAVQINYMFTVIERLVCVRKFPFNIIDQLSLTEYIVCRMMRITNCAYGRSFLKAALIMTSSRKVISRIFSVSSLYICSASLIFTGITP